ncbi:nuclear transport factor 2 family protein [Nostoc sp. UHCC 0926]|uniref:nuclear transport factor 2 family protein n=1 Tax=unclassified Nostoc TaxID=2593658 RepID=UPI00236084A3|nr:nuclear transport factor 2 family protein [Nostoc sp. UHCC 0926]WDD31706.1 nuclear transport factor 2 family protein [Nostoc sp. UHCC 0926]
MCQSLTQELEKLEVELREAMLRNDITALDRLLADEVIFTDPQGSVIDKVEDLSVHESGDLVVTSYETDELIVRVFGSTAITNLKVRLTGLFKGESFSGVYRYTRTYLKQNEQW